MFRGGMVNAQSETVLPVVSFIPWGNWSQAQRMTEKFTHSSEGSDITTYLAVMDFRSLGEYEC